ncbi:unnamed protein product [Cunninghamella echinulata]
MHCEKCNDSKPANEFIQGDNIISKECFDCKRIKKMRIKNEDEVIDQMKCCGCLEYKEILQFYYSEPTNNYLYFCMDCHKRLNFPSDKYISELLQQNEIELKKYKNGSKDVKELLCLYCLEFYDVRFFKKGLAFDYNYYCEYCKNNVKHANNSRHKKDGEHDLKYIKSNVINRIMIQQKDSFFVNLNKQLAIIENHQDEILKTYGVHWKTLKEQVEKIQNKRLDATQNTILKTFIKDYLGEDNAILHQFPVHMNKYEFTEYMQPVWDTHHCELCGHQVTFGWNSDIFTAKVRRNDDSIGFTRYNTLVYCGGCFSLTEGLSYDDRVALVRLLFSNKNKSSTIKTPPSIASSSSLSSLPQHKLQLSPKEMDVMRKKFIVMKNRNVFRKRQIKIRKGIPIIRRKKRKTEENTKNKLEINKEDEEEEEEEDDDDDELFDVKHDNEYDDDCGEYEKYSSEQKESKQKQQQQKPVKQKLERDMSLTYEYCTQLAASKTCTVTHIKGSWNLDRLDCLCFGRVTPEICKGVKYSNDTMEILLRPIDRVLMEYNGHHFSLWWNHLQFMGKNKLLTYLEDSLEKLKLSD